MILARHAIAGRYCPWSCVNTYSSRWPPTTALDTLAREKLSIDPAELGESAWEATAAVTFGVGRLIGVKVGG